MTKIFRSCSNYSKAEIIIAGCGLMFLLQACAPVHATQPESSAAVRTFVFNCAEEYSFVARIEGAQVWLFLPSGTLTLQQTAVNTFHDGNLMFRLDGQQGLLEESGGVSRSCRNDRRQAIWEHAKLNGADFRAIGNEPGWNLEIIEQTKLVLVTGYGSELYEFDLSKPEIDMAARTTRYRNSLDGQELTLTLTLTGEPCRDTMSGEEFETTVEVNLDGQTLRGCGRALH